MDKMISDSISDDYNCFSVALNIDAGSLTHVLAISNMVASLRAQAYKAAVCECRILDLRTKPPSRGFSSRRRNQTFA